MASTNSNKGRAVVLSAACVTMFFISSIALYSVVSKNLLAVYPEWSSALTWAFPVFQTIMAVTVSSPVASPIRSPPQRRDRRRRVLRPGLVHVRHRHRAVAVLPVVLARRRHRQRPGLQPRAHHRPKVVHRQEGSRLRHHPCRFDRRPRRAIPGARLAAHPEPGSSLAPQGARRHLLCDDRRLRPVPEGPRGRLAARGLRGPQGRRARRHFRRPHPGRDGQTPRFWSSSPPSPSPPPRAPCSWARLPPSPLSSSSPTPRAPRPSPSAAWSSPSTPAPTWSVVCPLADHRQARRLQVAAHQPCRHHRRARYHVDELYAEHVLCSARPARL